jgi:hypothetical protein
MDFCTKSTTLALPSSQSNHLTALGSIFRIYELFVRTTYDGLDPASLHQNAQDDNRTDSSSHTILTYIDEFTKATKNHGANLLRNPPKHFNQELSVRALFTRDSQKLIVVTGRNSADYRPSQTRCVSPAAASYFYEFFSFASRDVMDTRCPSISAGSSPNDQSTSRASYSCSGIYFRTGTK